MATVTASTAKVYRGGRRRWLTPAAACRAEARAQISRRCECDRVSHNDPQYTGHICAYHQDMDKYRALVERMARFYMRRICEPAP